MNVWEAIKYVSSGITLVAFIIALTAWVYRTKILERERTIRLAPENERRDLVERTLEFFSIDTAGLSRQQKYNLAIKQIQERAARFRLVAFVIIIIAFLTTGVSIFAIWRVPEPLKLKPDLTPTPTPILTAIPAPSNSSNDKQDDNRNGTNSQKPPVTSISNNRSPSTPTPISTVNPNAPRTPTSKNATEFIQLVNYARSIQKLGIKGQACREYMKAFKMLPDSYRGKVSSSLIEQAHSNYARNNFEEAARLFEDAFRAVPIQ